MGRRSTAGGGGGVRPLLASLGVVVLVGVLVTLVSGSVWPWLFLLPACAVNVWTSAAIRRPAATKGRKGAGGRRG